MRVKIQKAAIENLSEIQTLNYGLCKKEHDEFDKTINPNFSLDQIGKSYFADRISNSCALVALLDGKIVGYLVGSIIDVESYRTIGKIGEVENMFVVEKYRSIGVGKKLLEEFERWCAGKTKRVRAVVTAKNEKAIRFYERAGFEDYALTLEKEL